MSKRRGATLDRRGPQARPPAGKAALAVPVSGAADALRQTADALVEASWLAAAISLPLYFSVLTNTAYEPDKAALIRILATVAAGAWLLGFVLDRRRFEGFRGAPVLVGLGVLLFVTYVIATVFSIDLRLSLFGSQGRQEGLITHAAYTVFFVCVATRLRYRAQVERLITVLLFGSVPVVAYGVIQELGLDPIPYQGDFTTLMWPVRSTFGQHVFLGSYLVLVMPFTAARALSIWNDRTAPAARDQGYESLLAGMVILFTVVTFQSLVAVGFHRPALFALFPAVLVGYALLGLVLAGLPDSPGMRRARLGGYTGLLALQILVLAVSGARGPWLGALASLPVFGILLALWYRRSRLWQVMLAVSVAAGLFLLLLNIPGGPLQPLRTIPALHRVSDITESGGTEVGSVKGRLLIWQGVVTLMRTTPSIGHTWGGVARDLVGYGPESIREAFWKVFPVKLRQATFEIWSWDRAHNIYLDTLVDAGLLGLVTLLALFAVFFRAVIGMLRGASPATAWLLIAMGAAIGGHLVDGVFSLEMPATYFLVWMILGLAVSLNRVSDGAESEQPAVSLSLERVLTFWLGLIVLLGIAGLAFAAPAPGHPVILSAMLLLSTLGGVALLTWALIRRGATERDRRRGAGHVTAAPARSWPRSRLAALAAISVACLIVLGSQMQFETAAMADRDGTTSYSTGQAVTAISSLQEAARANGNEAVYRLELGGLYSSLAAASRPASAGPTFHPSGEDARTMDPQTVLTLDRGQLYALSAAATQSAIALSPLDPDMYAALGDTYREWKRPQEAIVQYRLAEQLGVNNPKYLDAEALAELDAHRADRALSLGLKAVGLDPTFWYSHYALALTYHQLGQRPAAQREAAASLFWVPVFHPAPPASQLTQLRRLQRTG